MSGILPDQLAQEIQKELGVYSDAVTDVVKKQIDFVTTETVKDLRGTSPKRTGDYAKDWAQKTSYENTRTKRNTVHNRKHYQLTHLLENGHAKRGGGRVAAKEHIAAVEGKMIQRLTKGIEEAITR